MEDLAGGGSVGAAAPRPGISAPKPGSLRVFDAMQLEAGSQDKVGFRAKTEILEWFEGFHASLIETSKLLLYHQSGAAAKERNQEDDEGLRDVLKAARRLALLNEENGGEDPTKLLRSITAVENRTDRVLPERQEFYSQEVIESMARDGQDTRETIVLYLMRELQLTRTGSERPDVRDELLRHPAAGPFVREAIFRATLGEVAPPVEAGFI